MRLITKCVMGFFLTTTMAHASNSDVGNISTTHFMNNGAVIFYHDGVRTGAVPSCASGFSTRWVINTNTAGGKTQAAALLTAYALRRQIWIIGSGTCDPVWSDTEGIAYFVVKDS